MPTLQHLVNCFGTAKIIIVSYFVRISCHFSFLYVAHQMYYYRRLCLAFSPCLLFFSVSVATVPHHTHAWVVGGVTR